jgi:long-chain fatty acid transport protein
VTSLYPRLTGFQPTGRTNSSGWSGGRRRDRRWRSLALIGVAVLAAPAAQGQTNSFASAIQLNFSTPGARSLGFGGAFIALADDATAAYVNPAGLTALTRPEVSIEGRSWSFSHVFTDRGRLLGTPTEPAGGFDSIAGLQNGEARNSVSGLSFFSLVYRDKRMKKWTLALYRHELANFRARFDTQGAIIEDSTRILPSRNNLSLYIVNLGLGAGIHITDGLSMGAGISRYSFSLASSTATFALEGPFSSPSYDPGSLFTSQLQEGEHPAFGFNLGLKWQANSEWRAGATYRSGPRFNFTTRLEPGPMGQGITATAGTARFTVPAVFGLGVAYQPDYAPATLTFDYSRVKYSALTSKLTSIFASVKPEDLQHFRVDDADELHLGFEYVFNLPEALGGLLATRVGAWRDPDHRIRYDGQNLTFRSIFRRGLNETHYSVGVGMARFIPWVRPATGGTGSHVQLDAAFDYSRLVKTASLSTVVGF